MFIYPQKNKLVLNSTLQGVFIACSCKCVGCTHTALLHPEHKILSVHTVLAMECIITLSHLECQGKNLKWGRCCTCVCSQGAWLAPFCKVTAQNKQSSLRVSVMQQCRTCAIVVSRCTPGPVHTECPPRNTQAALGAKIPQTRFSWWEGYISACSRRQNDTPQGQEKWPTLVISQTMRPLG